MGADRPSVAFRLLGPLEVVVTGEPVALRAAKVRSVLGVLLVHANRVVSCDRLVDVLWGDEPPATAANTLHTYVASIRRLLGPGRRMLQTYDPGYLLEVAPDALDVARFEHLAADGREALDRDPRRAAALLRESLALWRGPALADFADEPFARGEIARLEEARLAALEDRIRADLALGLHGALVGELEALVEAHPLREHLAGQLMLALYRSGRQAESLRAYQRLRRDLGEELGIEPSPALARLEAAVLAQAPELDLTGAATAGAAASSDLEWSPAARSPFVGRRRECLLLTQAWQAEGDDLRVVLLEGDPGVGKTRLLAEAGLTAHAAGHRVLYGRGDEHLGDAYRLFSRILERCRPGGGSWPEEPAPVDDADARRLRFFAAASAALAEASPRRLVLVLDDLQWADVPSLLLLRHLLRDAPRFPLTVLAVLGLGPRPPALVATVSDLERDGALQRIELGGLRTEDVEELFDLSVAPLDQALVPQLWSETGGNALFVTEAIRELASPERDGSWPVLPASVPEVVARRLRALPAPARALVVGAAVVGTAADGPLLGRIADLEREDTIAALDEAAAGRLLVAAPGAPGNFEFSHRMVRSAIYEQLPPARRLDLHRRVALAMEHEGRGHDQPAELARHWTAAGHFGDPVAAIRYLRLAGDAADRRTGYEAAVGHYRSALALMDEHPRLVDPADRCELLLAVAATENRSGDVNAGKAACSAAAQLARALQRGDLLARAALEYGGLLPTGTDVDDPESLTLLRLALEGAHPGTKEAALVAARLAELEYWVLPRHERRVLCDEAVTTVRRLDDRRALTEVLLHRFWALNCPDEIEERLALADELDRLVTGEDRELSLRTGKCRLHLLLELGDFDAACRLSDQMSRIASELNHREHQRLALAFDAMRAGVEGRYEDAGRLIREASTMLDRRGNPDHARLVAFLQEIPRRWLQGRLGEVLDQARSLANLQPERLFWKALVAWAETESGHLDRVGLSCADVEAFVARGPSLDWWSVLAASANVAVALEDQAMAGLVHGALAPYARRNLVGGQVAFYGAVSHVLGVLDAMAGRAADAQAHLDAALERHRAMRATPFVALTAAELARLTSPADDRLGAEAAAIAAQLGLAHVSGRLPQPTAG